MTYGRSPESSGGGFTTVEPPARDARLRLNDFYEVYVRPSEEDVMAEGARCMNCGAAFCQPSSGYRDHTGAPAGCPIDNKIPEWNELVAQNRWREAYLRLDTTNNFPEFTSRLCPAPCQDACIHGINERPVAIKNVERAIIDRAFEEGWAQPNIPAQRTGKRVAIIGSGPAGLAAADQLNKRGHHVTVYEKADRPGGLLTYGVPNMKLDKGLVERRIGLLQRGGIEFVTGVEVGVDLDPDRMASDFDALLLACGAMEGRDLSLPGRSLAGIHMAMDYLEAATRHYLGHQDGLTPGGGSGGGSGGPRIDAKGKEVIIIGGGDTGADCIATALRQGCKSLLNVTRRDKPPTTRNADHPWPGPTGAYQLDYAHKEGLTLHGRDPRDFGVEPESFVSDAAGRRVAGLRIRRGNDHHAEILPADLVILAAGFTGHRFHAALRSLGLTDSRARIDTHPGTHRTRRGNIFAAGDARMGPSLVVHAIAEGRAAAAEIDRYLADLS